MSYYKRRYRRRSYGKREDPFAAFIALVALAAFGLILALLNYIAKNPWIIFVGAAILLGVYLLYRKYFKRNASQESLETSAYNRERHTSREYFSGTNDGEKEVAVTLAQELPYKEYFIFNNLTIPSQLIGSAQIDHLVISKYGVFVIETKDYKGWIFGSSDQPLWTQSLPGGNNKFQFENPLRQNWSHVQALKELLPMLQEDKFVNIAVFTESSEFKTSLPENVVKIDNLTKCILSYQNTILSEEIIYAILGKLFFVTQAQPILLSEHLKNLSDSHPGDSR